MSTELNEEFIFEFIKEKKPAYLSRLSNHSPKQMTNSMKDKIKIGNRIINIPTNILQEKNENTVELSGFHDQAKSIYYFDPSIKKYYEILTDINIDQYQLNIDELLRIDFNYEKTENLDLNFVVIELSDTKGIVDRKYGDLTHVTLNPHPDTTHIKIYIKPKTSGFIYNSSLKIDKQKMNILNEYKFNMTKEDLYNPNEKINFIENNNKIRAQVPNLNKKFVYFSYGIKNNSFNKLPDSSLVSINAKNLYQVTTPYYKTEEIDFIPTLIEYNNTEKTNLIKLSSNSEFVRFQNDTNAIRLSYRFVGIGEVEILPVTVIEYESETSYESVDWSSRHEIDVYMKTINDVKDLRIATIMDEFTYHSYQHEASLLRLSANNWKNELISFMPHFLLIESSWHGNDGDWTKKVAYVTEEKHQEIKRLISLAKSLSIPVVFWNKEDPVHFDHFIETAKLCDYVFTTDRDRVEDYKMACNHENVDVLQFAAQPRTHNPTKIQKERVNGISFAGSYYALREERSNDMNRLFRASIPYNLYIYDRNYEFTKIGEKMNFLFPEEFREYILGSLPFYQIDKAYKGYKYMININTVKTSPTMYARRVYEGLASGTPIISNYSLGMINQFGDLIGTSESEEELIAYLENLENNADQYNKVKQLGIRRVLSEHTYEHRLIQIADTLGYEFTPNEKKVTFISFINNEKEISNIIEKYTGIHYSNKQLIIVINDDIRDYSLLNNNISIINENRIFKTFGTLSKLIDTDYISVLNQSDYYAPNYLKDLILAEQYTDADVIGKSNYFNYENDKLDEVNENSEHEYTVNINLYASIIHSNLFSNFNLNETFNYLKGDKVITELNYLGFKMYSNDKMNYIKNGNNLTDSQKYNAIV